MTFTKLSSNAELLDYLKGLVEELRRSGDADVADIVLKASYFSGGSPSEFLHEARIALGVVSSKCSGSLPSMVLEQVSCVAAQIDAAFREVGGA